MSWDRELDRELAGSGMTSARTRQRLIQTLQQKGIRSPQVLDVMEQIPRHLFIDEALSHRAYEETALPIGHGQTISQPYIVARMTELVMEIAPKKVLEIGTGCGYQTAILATMVDEIFSIERIAGLYTKTRALMLKLKIQNVRLRHGDGYIGWKQHQPFDAIIVTAAPQEIPKQLFEQLSDGGRMIIPLGDKEEQNLYCYTRKDDEIEEQLIEKVSFVPMLSGSVTNNGQLR